MVLSESDRQLLDRCLAGSEGAWETLVDRYIALITHVVVSTARLRLDALPPELRDDLVAEVLMALVDDDFAILRRFKQKSSLGTYLVVVSRRIVARRLAKLGPHPHLSLEAADAQAAQEEAEENLRALENEQEVEQLLAKLPSDEAAVIRMYHLEHRSYAEISSHLGISANSVGPLLSRARQHIRKLKQE